MIVKHWAIPNASDNGWDSLDFSELLSFLRRKSMSAIPAQYCDVFVHGYICKFTKAGGLWTSWPAYLPCPLIGVRPLKFNWLISLHRSGKDLLKPCAFAWVSLSVQSTSLIYILFHCCPSLYSHIWKIYTRTMPSLFAICQLQLGQSTSIAICYCDQTWVNMGFQLDPILFLNGRSPEIKSQRGWWCWIWRRIIAPVLV